MIINNDFYFSLSTKKNMQITDCTGGGRLLVCGGMAHTFK